MSFRDKNAFLSQYFCKTLLSDSVIVNSEGYFNKEDITSDAVQLAFSEIGFLTSSYYDVTLTLTKLHSTTGMKGGSCFALYNTAPEDCSQSVGKL